jgi:aminoglycoside phosphotransferase (APT) family kinase protein
MFCKVHAWYKGLELEANIIRFVTENALSMPVPEVIHSWINRDLNRTFLITKQVTGQTLEEAWPQLSSSQHTQIAEKIARYYATLATRTSSHFETVTRCGVFKPRLIENTQQSHPIWLPRTLGPFSSEGIVTYMTNMSAEPPPDINTPFILYHANLGPTNIIVSKNSNVITGIIDWESAAYYPRFWVATKPIIASAFWLESTTIEPKLWGKLLGQALEAMSYKRLDTIYRNWNNTRRL